MSPRAKARTLWVIPQAGQGHPVLILKPHGLKISPKSKWTLSNSQRATKRTPIDNAIAAATLRSLADARRNAGVSGLKFEVLSALHFTLYSLHL
jgi:hypothetical protein